jgi:hypothetical protein
MGRKAKNKKQAGWEEGHRECVKCKQMLPFSMFHKHRQCLFGINTVCKVCRVPKSKEHWKDVTLETKILQRARSRAGVKGIPFDLDIADIQIPVACPVFNKPFVYGDLDWAASLDKIDPSKGYTKGNIRIISNKANRMKSDATKEELIMFSNWIKETQ